MGQRRDFAIFLSTILFGAAVAPQGRVAPFVSIGHLREGSHSHYCMATVVERDEEATHTGPRRLYAITTEVCSHVMGQYENRHAQFELGPADVLGSVKGGLKKWNIHGQLFDLGQWSRVGVVTLQAEGFGEARERVLAAETEALQNVPTFVADWNEGSGQLTRTEATIVPFVQCFPRFRNSLPPEAELYKNHFICVQTSENIKFSYGAPLYKITGQGYNLLGILTASQHYNKNQHLFLNVRAYTDTFEGLIG